MHRVPKLSIGKRFPIHQKARQFLKQGWVLYLLSRYPAVYSHIGSANYRPILNGSLPANLYATHQSNLPFQRDIILPRW